MTIEIYTKFKSKQPLSQKELEIFRSIKVVQPSVMYVIGIRSDFCQEDLQKSTNFFGKYGPVASIRINKNSGNQSPKDQRSKLFRVYVTYKNALSSSIAILSINMNSTKQKNGLITAFSANRLCKFFIKGKTCLVKHCNFLHSLTNPNLILSEGINVSETLSFETQKKFVIENALENFKDLKKLKLDQNKCFLDSNPADFCDDFHLPDSSFAVEYLQNQISASKAPSLEKKVYQVSKTKSVNLKEEKCFQSNTTEKEQSVTSKGSESSNEVNTRSQKSKHSLKKSQNLLAKVKNNEQNNLKNIISQETQYAQNPNSNHSAMKRFKINNASLQKERKPNVVNQLMNPNNDVQQTQVNYPLNVNELEAQNLENYYENNQDYYAPRNQGSYGMHSNPECFNAPELQQSGMHYNYNQVQNFNNNFERDQRHNSLAKMKPQQPSPVNDQMAVQYQKQLFLQKTTQENYSDGYDAYMRSQNENQYYSYEPNMNMHYHEMSNSQHPQNFPVENPYNKSEINDYLLKYYIWNEYASKKQTSDLSNHNEQSGMKNDYHHLAQNRDYMPTNYLNNNIFENYQKPSSDMQIDRSQYQQTYTPFGIYNNKKNLTDLNIEKTKKLENEQRTLNLEYENTKFINRMNLEENIPSAYNFAPFLSHLDNDQNS